MQEPSPSVTKPLRKTLISVGVMLFFVGMGSAAIQRYVLPQRMQSLLHEAPATQISTRMDYLVKNAPLPHRVLAQLLASPRPEVSAEAARRLELLVQEWEQRPGNEVADQALVLVQELQHHFSACSPSVQRSISEIVSRMARWDLGNSPAEQARYLTAIEELAKASLHPSMPARSAASETLLSRYLEDFPPTASTVNPITPPLDDSFAIDLSAGTPWESVGLPKVPTQSSVASLPENSSPADAAVLPLRNRPVEANQPLAVKPPLKLPRLRDQPLALESVRDDTETLVALDKLTTWEVIWNLHEPDEKRMAQAEAELARRRFSPADLQLARQISAPDLATRLQAVRELPRMSRNDVKMWLYYMTKDPDETVRYAAAAALLTSADSRIHRQLKVDLANDPSLRVRELLRR